MDAGLFTVRQTRVHPRHELHTLTYVTLDQANGGIVRDISHQGIGVQMVAAVPAQQQLSVRFELGHPRLRVETLGEVSWSKRSGQCGIRFLDLSPSVARQINEWIFGNLIEEVYQHWAREGSIFSGTGLEDAGLMVSADAVQIIEMPASPDLPGYDLPSRQRAHELRTSKLDWLFQPLSGRGLIWTVNTLVVVAALLLFALVFLSITGEPPHWPLATASAAAIFVAGLYWGFFRLFGGVSPGARLARMAGLDLEEGEEATDARFR
jgi:hypothetical protein